MGNQNSPGPSPGSSSYVHNIQVPNEYDDWVSAYSDMVGKIDAGLAVVVDTKSELDALEDSSLPDDILALNKGNGKFYTSSGGQFHETSIGGVDTSKFVERSGDTMEGKLDLNSHSDAGIILPTL